MTAQKFAVIGSGPSGCYAAERLARKAAGPVEIDVYDRLPTPFGLVRAGVAPDHQSIKIVARVMAKTLARDEVRFMGNVQIGRDISLDRLRECYDAVLVAIGAPEDRPLGISGDDLVGVIGSGAYTRWYNSHPEHADNPPPLEGVTDIVVIGNGNVALDVTRLLAKHGPEFEGSDLSPEVEGHLLDGSERHITIVGRRDPAANKFSPLELREIAELEAGAMLIDPSSFETEASDEDDKSVVLLRDNAAEFEARVKAGKAHTIRFEFRLSPEEVLGDDEGRVRAVRFRRNRMEGDSPVQTEETVEIPAQLVVPCIGYRSVPIEGLPMAGGKVPNDDGLIDAGFYVVGWAKRGPSGTIGTNRGEAQDVAQRMLDECPAAGKPGRDAILADLAGSGITPVDWEGWTRIEAAEEANAAEGRVRRKFHSVNDMVKTAG